MKTVLLLLTAVAVVPAQTTFVYNDGYPAENCADTAPNGFKWPTKAICPVPILKKPPVGKKYKDPVFGKTAWLVTDDGKVNTYSVPTPLSAAGRYAAVTEQGYTYIYETENGKFVKGGERSAGLPSQDWGFWWDPADDDAYYYHRKRTNGNWVIIRGRVKSDREEVVFEVGQIPQFFSGGTGGLTGDRWLAYATVSPQMVQRARQSGDAAAAERLAAESQICAAPLDGTHRKYCISTAKVPTVKAGGLDFFLLSDFDTVAQKRFLMVLPWGVVLSVDMASRTLKYEYTAPENPSAKIWRQGNGDGVCDPGESCLGGAFDHADTFTLAGETYLFATMEQEPLKGLGGWGTVLGAWKFNSSAAEFLDAAHFFPIMLSSRSHTGGAPGYHYGCSRSAAAPVCVTTTSGPPVVGRRVVTEPLPPNAYEGEFIAVEFVPPAKPSTSPSFRVHRLAKHLSFMFGPDSGRARNNYYQLPRAGISGDGSRVLGTTTWLADHGSAQQSLEPLKTIAVDTGIGGAARAAPPPEN